MKRVEQKLEGLSCRRGLRPLLQTVLEGHKRAIHGAPILVDLLPELHQRGPHAHHGGVDVDELGAEVDEVGVVAVDQVDKLVVEGGQVRLELRSERVEGNEGPELRDVGLGVECRRKEERGLEPERVGVQRVREEVRRRSRRCGCRDQIRHFGFGFLSVSCLGAEKITNCQLELVFLEFL